MITEDEIEKLKGERDHAWFMMEQMELGEIEELMKFFLLVVKEPVSILECRSGWRVFIQTGWHENGYEATGKNLAYSNECGGFKKMLLKAKREYHVLKRKESNAN